MPTFEELLYQSAALHQHLCPRQVLGVRMGLAAGRWLSRTAQPCAVPAPERGITARQISQWPPPWPIF